MKYNWVEVITGFLVLVLGVVFASYAFRVAGGTQSGDSYTVSAEFASAEGIQSGGDVRMAGVKVGRVGDMWLNNETFGAHVDLKIDDSVQIPLDSEVKIAMDGLLGGAFVEIVPGADMEVMAAGDQFTIATGSVSLLSLFASFVSGGSNSSSDGGAAAQ